MREIKFRGMEVFDKKWVYGWLANIAATSDKRNNKGWRIIENISDGNVYTPVIPDTVGEFAGLSDINGKEIYEGDIVLIPYNHIGNIVVSYKNGRYNISQYKWDEGEVIGNIYENPEMVKE